MVRDRAPQECTRHESIKNAIWAIPILFAVDNAARLGYSESTLSRACLAAVGRSAKQVIDRRVALEAARQWVPSQLSVAEIGHGLGFTEATNFAKFFGRMNGLSSQAFRQTVEMQGRTERPTIDESARLPLVLPYRPTDSTFSTERANRES